MSDSCPLCRQHLGNTLVTLTTPDKYEQKAGISDKDYRREWRDCPGCHAVIDQPLSPEAAKLDAWATGYYEVEQATEAIDEKFARIMGLPHDQSDNRLRVQRVRDYLDHWHRLRGRAPEDIRRVMDIGAGIGVFLSALQEGQSNWDATGIEPDPLAAEHLRGLDAFTVYQGLFSGQDELTGFDLVTLNKVVEHIREPHELLGQVRNAVAPDGVLYVEVPHRLSVEHHPPEHFILGALHHHLYAVSSLTSLLEQCGWQPMDAGTVYEPSGKVSCYAFSVLPGCLG